jgi:AraC-like DNA-binding protein
MNPLGDIITLLSPRAMGTKLLQGAGNWAVQRSNESRAGFGIVLKGGCWLSIDGYPPLYLAAGDVVLMPESTGLTISSSLNYDATNLVVLGGDTCTEGKIRYGSPEGNIDFEQLGGYFQLDPINQGMLGRLLPTIIHIKAADLIADSIKRVIDLIVEEAAADHPGKILIVDRFIEILLIKALRHYSAGNRAYNQPGLVMGLLDPALARALRELHHDVSRQWSVESLAREAGLSRSSFSQRFGLKVGISPMQYVIDWRMTIAKTMLKGNAPPLELVADTIGYKSASAFSTAFRREIGCSPTEFSRRVFSE